MSSKSQKFHWKPKSLNAVAIAQFIPIQIDLSAYPETEKLSVNRFHPRDQVELNVGDIACVLEELSGWYRGYVFSPSNPQAKPRLGIFPANHVINIRKREYKDQHSTEKTNAPSIDDINAIPDTKPRPDEIIRHENVELVIKSSSSIPADILNTNAMQQIKSPDGAILKVRKVGGNPLPDPCLPFYITKYASDDPLIDEVTVVLRDWFFNLRGCLRRQDYKSYALIKKNVNSLLRGRRQLLARKHVGQTISTVRLEILNSIAEGNEMQKFHQVIRDKESGEVITPKLSTVMKMHQTHTHLQWQVNPESKKQQPRSFDVFDQEYLQKEEQQVQFHHFYFESRENQLLFPSEGPYEIHFQILLKSDSTPLCETFIIKYESSKPVNTSQYLITNLSPLDASLDTLIVGKIFKKEAFSDKCQETVVRRPLGIVFLESKDIFNGKESQPTNGYFMKLYLISNENNFGKLHERILEANTLQSQGGLFVNCKTLVGDLDTILKTTTLFDPKTTTLVNRINFPSVITPSIARNKIHVTLRSGDFQRSVSRNIEIAIHLRNNYTGQVIDSAMSMGRGIPNNAVYESSLHYHSLQPVYNETFTVDCPVDILTDSHLYFAIRALHTSDKERKETKVISFAFMPITKDNKMISNGVKDLCVYKYEKSKTSPGTYLTLPILVSSANENVSTDSISVAVNLCSSKYPQNHSLFQFLNWRKIVESTHETFKPLLIDLKTVKESEILFALSDILTELFDLQQSAKNTDGVLDVLIFQSILHVIGLTQDNKYSKFEPNVIKFIEEKFNCPNAHVFLVHFLIKLIDDNNSNGNLQYVKEVRATFKIVHYIFMLIFKSMKQCKEKQVRLNVAQDLVNETDLVFNNNITKFVNSICGVMSDVSNDVILGTQTTILQYLDRIIIEFLKYFGPIKTAEYTILMADAVNNKKSTVINYKLVFMMNIVKSPLYKNKLARPLLSAAIAKWLTISFLDPGVGDKQSRKEVFRKCVFVLAETLDTMQQVLQVNKHLHSQDIYTDYQSLQTFAKILPTLIDVFEDSLSTTDVQTKLQTKTSLGGTNSVINPTATLLGLPGSPSSPNTASSGITSSNAPQINVNSPSILSGVIAATMLIIFHLLDKQELLAVFHNELNTHTNEKSTRLLKLIMNSINSMIVGECFPDEWSNITLFTNKTALKMFEVVGMLSLQRLHIIQKGPFGPTMSFDKTIWVSLFKGVLNLLQNHFFNTRKESQQFKRVEMILDANIEIEGAQFLKSLWDAIGIDNYHLQLTNDLMSHVCQLSVSSNTTCQQSSAYILFSMMKREYQFCASVQRIETLIIEELDKLFSMGLGDDGYRKALIYNLTTYHKYLLIDDGFKMAVEKVIYNINQFCVLVLNVRQLDQYGDEYEEERWDGILKLAFFMKTVNKQDIYIKYIHHLSQMQLKRNNFVEAGLTLLHHAAILEWGDGMVPVYADIGFNKEQSQFERKEELYCTILEYFDEGKAWEKGILLAKELCTQYEQRSYDYKKLANMLKRLGVLYESIINKERYHSEYFRVGFYGKAWPMGIRNKLFIYRGFEFEKISVFCERILNKHAGSMMLKNNNAPTEEILQSNKKHIQITAVQCEPQQQSIFTNENVPEVVKNYYISNEIEHFSFSRPFRKGAKTGNEFLDLWTEKTIYKTAERFPHALKRSMIVSNEKVEYSPIENALKTMIGKNKELATLETMFSQKDANKLNCNPLTMSLNGSVDAPVNGGVPMYKKAFLNDEFKLKYPDKAEFVPQLADAIDEQIIIISRCLDVHSKVVIPAMRPLHENLVKSN
eukprot:NODE_225_length_13912_cov_0.499674.p1 type:complete len:1792 gc:universal NODE_225_length_13912_cov_0.499674:5111-10486(+)